MISQSFIDEMHKALLDKKTELLEELKGLAPHTEIGQSLEDGAEEFEIDASNQDVIATIKRDLDKIDLALDRITNGTYGIDDEGKEISEERLRVIPWADKAL